MFIDLRDHLRSGLSDLIQRGLQLRRFFSMGPARHIGKAVVTGVDSVMLAHRECHGFRFHFLMISGELRLRRICLCGRIGGMKLLVRHLMDRGLDGLHLAHPFLNGDAVLNRMKISLGSAVDLFETDRHRAGFFQGVKEHLILRHITGQFIHANRG